MKNLIKPIVRFTVPIEAIIITETDCNREETDRSLKKSEERFRTIVSDSQDSSTVVDENGTIVHKSPSITSLLGYQQDELLGEAVFEHRHPEALTVALNWSHSPVTRPDIRLAKSLKLRSTFKDEYYLS